MSTIRLSYFSTSEPDFDGFFFIIESGGLFDASAYAESYGMNQYDIDYRDIHAVQDAAARLGTGEWLVVTHDVLFD